MNCIDVFYSHRQVSCPESSSPSPRKPEWVMKEWLDQNLPVRVLEPVAATRDQIARAHSPAYVDGILSCELMNGFRGRQKEVALSLPWTCGSFLSAAQAAIDNGLVACSPTSGFHHAGVETAYGYCTFNGLMVAALSLQTEGGVRRVGILDCDQHFGDGTAEIIQSKRLDWVQHVSREYTDPADSEPFLAKLPEVVKSFAGCDLLMYQAGADSHVNDPLGGFLTTEQLIRRDEIVFSTAKAMGIPLVWNLAGGYQEPVSHVLAIHNNTMRACAAVFLDTFKVSK
jgi:acetoin utilization deacetylase AcuC-like enzyme